MAALDEMSGGRAFIGIGAGGGLALGPLAIERVRPLQVVSDAVLAMRHLFAGESVTMTSATFALDNAQLGYCRPDIEIIVAGRGPRITELGGRIGDGFYLSYPYLPGLADQVHSVRNASNGAPRHVVWSTGVARDDHERAQMRTQLTFRLVDSPAAVRATLGIDDELRDNMRAAIAAGGPPAAAHLVSNDWLSHFGVVGDTATCQRVISDTAQRCGIDEFMVPVQDLGRARDLITSFAPSPTITGKL